MDSVAAEEPVEPPARGPGKLLDGHVGHQVQVQLRAQLLEQVGQPQDPFLGREDRNAGVDQGIEVFAQVVTRPVPGRHGEAGAQDAGLDGGVQEHRDECVLEARHHVHVVGEGVGVPALAEHLGDDILAQRLGHVVDDQDLEARPRVRQPPAWPVPGHGRGSPDPPRGPRARGRSARNRGSRPRPGPGPRRGRFPRSAHEAPPRTRCPEPPNRFRRPRGRAAGAGPRRSSPFSAWVGSVVPCSCLAA